MAQAFRKRAKIGLDPQQICHFLELPDRLEIVGVYAESDPMRFVIFVEGDDLDPVPLNAESPYLSGALQHRRIIGPDGLMYSRWGWEEAPTAVSA